MFTSDKNAVSSSCAGAPVFVRPAQVTAADATRTLSIAATSGVPITASTTSRTLGGVVVRYGEYGRTSAGRLRVKAGALRFPDDLTRVKLTREHDRDQSRGHLVAMADDGSQLRISARVSDGPDGDAALLDASDGTRDGLSFDVVDAVIEGDWIVDAEVIAIGQVGIPAYGDGRIDQIAANQTQQGNPTGGSMTEEQRARLAELRAKQNLTDAERAELDTLVALETAEQEGAQASDDGDQGNQGGGDQGEQRTTASVPAVPSGAGPARRSPTTTAPRQPQGGHLRRFVDALAAGLAPGGNVTAALADITNSGADGGILSTPAWSGELWSGVQHEREFVPLLNHGDLTNWEGKGWRWVTKPEMQDYAGNKAAIPSAPVDTEPSGYTAARMAVGHDLDRKFYDFPDRAFLESYVSAVAESWSVKSDLKALAYITTNAADSGASASTLLKAAALGMRKVKRNTRTRGTFVIASDNDFDQLMDISEHDVPAFLQLFDVNPGAFTSSDQVPDGTVIVGTKNAATFRELPGSPIRVSAQHIANGGVDEGFFGYWAVEEHHPSGIVAVDIVAAP